MINLNHAKVNREKDEGEIALSATFQKEHPLNRVDIIEDWIEAIGQQMRRAGAEMSDPNHVVSVAEPSRYSPVKLQADFNNGEGEVVMPRWFSKAPPFTRFAFLRDWERLLTQARTTSLEEWKSVQDDYIAEFRTRRIRSQGVGAAQ